MRESFAYLQKFNSKHKYRLPWQWLIHNQLDGPRSRTRETNYDKNGHHLASTSIHNHTQRGSPRFTRQPQQRTKSHSCQIHFPQRWYSNRGGITNPAMAHRSRQIRSNLLPSQSRRKPPPHNLPKIKQATSKWRASPNYRYWLITITQWHVHYTKINQSPIISIQVTIIKRDILTLIIHITISHTKNSFAS